MPGLTVPLQCLRSSTFPVLQRRPSDERPDRLLQHLRQRLQNGQLVAEGWREVSGADRDPHRTELIPPTVIHRAAT